MAFKRALLAAAPLDADALTAAMAGIGMGLAATPAPDPNIEDTLLLASVGGRQHQDFRTLALLATWFDLHAEWVNADRLTRFVPEVWSRVVYEGRRSGGNLLDPILEFHARDHLGK